MLTSKSLTASACEYVTIVTKSTLGGVVGVTRDAARSTPLRGEGEGLLD
jgi:hypothetical protein